MPIRWFCRTLSLAILFPLLTAGQGFVSLPLQGYYHPGKYMPVQVSASPHSKDYRIELAAPGAITTYIRFEGGKLNTIVPWMPLDSRAQSLVCNVLPWTGEPPTSTPLKMLTDRQRIIGYAGVDAASAVVIATSLFPGDELIPIPLSPSQPFQGNPACWDTLDAAILDSATATRAGETAFASLVAQGVTFAIRGDAGVPSIWPNWPWNQFPGNWRAIQYRPAGPTSAIYNDAIYEQLSSFHTGWPPEVRRTAMLYAGVFAILFLLLALWRPRGTTAWAMLLSIFCIAAFTYLQDRFKPIQTAGGKIRVISPGITQDDDWSFHACHQRFVTFIRWTDTTRIMFGSSFALDKTGCRLECYPNGDPDFLFFVLSPEMKIALLSRRCGPREPSVKPNDEITSPLASLAKTLYVKQGDRLEGGLPAAPLMNVPNIRVQSWPGIAIRRGANANPPP